MESSLFMGVDVNGFSGLPQPPEIYIPTNIWQSNELSCLVMQQQTSYQQN